MTFTEIKDRAPPIGTPILAQIAYSRRGTLMSEWIVCIIDTTDGGLRTEGGDDIGWPESVIVAWCELPECIAGDACA